MNYNDYNALPKWNGKDSTERYQYPQDEIERWDMRIDSEGTVHYRTLEQGRPWRTWCPGNILSRHLHYLEQIEFRK